jgi:hypothetical protein
MYKMVGTGLTSEKDFLRVAFRLREDWSSLGCTSSVEPSSRFLLLLALLSGNYEEKENRQKGTDLITQCYNFGT